MAGAWGDLDTSTGKTEVVDGDRDHQDIDHDIIDIDGARSRIGTFSSSSAELNAVYEASMNTLVNLVLGGMSVDCAYMNDICLNVLLSLSLSLSLSVCVCVCVRVCERECVFP